MAGLDHRPPQQPVIAAPVTLDQQTAANGRRQEWLMTSALPARQPFARVTGSFEEVRESRKSGSVIGVVGHGQIGRTTQAG